MIKKMGDEYLLMDKSGKRILGRHKSRKAAINQEKAIMVRKRTGK